MKTKRILITVEVELAEKVAKIADAEGRSFSNYVVQLLKQDLKTKGK